MAEPLKNRWIDDNGNMVHFFEVGDQPGEIEEFVLNGLITLGKFLDSSLADISEEEFGPTAEE